MIKDLVCRHGTVEWLTSHQCCCQDCGKHGHFFEEGFAIWTMSQTRPADEPDDAWMNDYAPFIPRKAS